MRNMCVLVLLLAPALRADSIDGRVVEVALPETDATLYYVEAKDGMTAELRSHVATFKAKSFYLGDGKVALPFEVVSGKGMLFQRTTEMKQGHVFRKGSTVKVLPGYKRASDLKPGEVYVILPGVTFEVPAKE